MSANAVVATTGRRHLRTFFWYATSICTIVGAPCAVYQCTVSSTASTVITATQTSTANVVVSSTYQLDMSRRRAGLLGDKGVIVTSRASFVISNDDGEISGVAAVRISVPEDCKAIRFAADPLFVQRFKGGRRRVVTGHFQSVEDDRDLWLEVPTMPAEMQLAFALEFEQRLDRATPAEVCMFIHDAKRRLATHCASYSPN